MPNLVVRNLDETLVKALKTRVLMHHRSTEAERRAILTGALLQPKRKTFAEAI